MDTAKSFAIIAIKHAVPSEHWKRFGKDLEKGCSAVEGHIISLLEKGKSIEFEKHNTKSNCPYVIYRDFECLTTKSEQNEGSYKNTSLCLRLSIHLMKLRLHTSRKERTVWTNLLKP